MSGRENRAGAGPVGRVRRLYGAHPAHLIALTICFAIAVLAGRRLFTGNPLGVGEWIVGAAVLHDLLVLPLYAGVNLGLVMLARRRPGRVPWLNHVRIPLGISAVLFLVYSPEILGHGSVQYRAVSGRPAAAYLSHWLLLSAALGIGSALLYAARVGTHLRNRG